MRLEIVSGVNVRSKKLIDWLTGSPPPISEWSDRAIVLTKMEQGPGIRKFSVWPILNGVIGNV